MRYDALLFMLITFPVFHLETSLLNAHAFSNTNHHRNVQNNGHGRMCSSQKKQKVRKKGIRKLSSTITINITCVHQCYVLMPILVFRSTFHLETSLLNTSASRNTTHHLNNKMETNDERMNECMKIYII